jgi:Icc-related predicted phosphoesterase
MSRTYLRVFSDIHQNCCVNLRATAIALRNRVVGDDLSDVFWAPVRLHTDKDTILVLPGDLWECDKIFSFNGWSWIATMSKRFKSVVFCLGNHDYWSTNFDKIHKKIAAHIQDQGLTNVFCLENSSVTLDGIRFIGGTLWTDMQRGDPLAVMAATTTMNDFRYIRTGINYSKFNTSTWLDAHRATRRFIFETLNSDAVTPTVVLSHHLPSFMCISPAFEHGPYGPYYASTLDAEIHDAAANTNLVAWFHGHTHDTCYQDKLGIPIIANPFGYLSSQEQFDAGVAQNQKFDPHSLYEIVIDGDKPRLRKVVNV